MEYGQEEGVMKKWLNIVLAFIVLLSLLFGCSTTGKDKKIRCPKCGSFYDTKEGEEMFRWIQGR